MPVQSLRSHTACLLYLLIGLFLLGGLLILYPLPHSAARITDATRLAKPVADWQALPALQGEAAKDYLKQQGVFDRIRTRIEAERYRIRPTQGATSRFEASNVEQDFYLSFTDEVVRLQLLDKQSKQSKSPEPGKSFEFAMRFNGYGYGKRIIRLPQAEMKAEGNRLNILRSASTQLTNRRLLTDQRSALTEWYVNSAEGLEQGFILNHRPLANPRDEGLQLRLGLTGKVKARQAGDGDGIVIESRDGKQVVRYNKLKAYDARGVELATTMRVVGREVWLEVEEREAVYPLTIDPLFSQVKKLIAFDGGMQDQFGHSVSISGDTLIVGAISDDVGSNNSQGSAYVFARNQGGANNWGEVKKLTVSDGAADDRFGFSVAISGDTVIVGASNDDVGGNLNRGSAYVYERNQGGADNWGLVKHLTASDGTADDLFGWSVAIGGDTLVVGATSDDVGHQAQGSAYVYERNQGGANNWGEVKHLTASDGGESALFGQSVAVSGDILVVGANQDIVNSNLNQGSAYVYGRNQGGANNWGEVKKLVASDGAEGDFFGWSLAISGDTVVVGAFGDNDSDSSDQGSAYVYERNQGGADNWGETKHLTASDGAADDRFGYSVAISGDTIVAGAVFDDVGGNSDQGSAYVYGRNQGGANNWGEVKHVLASDGAEGDVFGWSLAISDNTFVVGASADDIGSNDGQGSAYTFAQCDQWIEEKKTIALDGAADDQFGYSVAISGDTLVVGAIVDNGGLGSAYVYERNQGGANNWGEVKHLLASDSGGGDFFGWSVAISGDSVVVGAIAHDVSNNLGQGSAYVYGRNQGGANNWGEVKKLVASDGATFDNFGHSVAISDDTIVVGAIVDDGAQGSAYVYERNQGGANNWGEVKKLTASDGMGGDQFGNSVTIGGNTVVVGARYDDVGSNNDQGSAYVYERNQGGANNWGEVKHLFASDSAQSDQFGWSVAISGDTLVVGVTGDNKGQGSAYVFARNQGGANNWGQVTKLAASDSTTSDQFGFSVAVSGDTVVVGAHLDDVGSNSTQGSAYVFARNQGGANNWGEVKHLFASDSAQSDQFGFSVAVSGDTVVVGAHLDDVGSNSDQGSAYVFVINCPPEITSTTLSRPRNSSQNLTIAMVTDDRTPAGSITVTATSVPAGIAITKIVNTNGTITANVTVDCSATLGANNITLQATDSEGGIATATLIITVTADTISPTITCPANLTRQTPQAGQACATVNFTATASDNCSGVSVVCLPPSGSCFAVGTTTVTCTATDTSGNQASCSFAVTVFNVCLQDDNNASAVLLWNSLTGDYLFCCGGTVFAGKGTATRQGNVFRLTHNPADRRVSAMLDATQNRGNASLQTPVGTNRCSITDRDIRNNACQCGTKIGK